MVQELSKIFNPSLKSRQISQPRLFHVEIAIPWSLVTKMISIPAGMEICMDTRPRKI